MTSDRTTPPVTRSEADILDLAPVIPVVVVDSVEQAVPLARALLRGGIPVIELTLRSAAGLGAIEAVASEVEGMVVGAGTVVTPEQVRQVAGRRCAVHRHARARRRGCCRRRSTAGCRCWPAPARSPRC